MTFLSPSNVTNLSGLFVYSHSVTSGWLAPVLTFMIFGIVLFALVNKTDFGDAWVAASFSTLVLSAGLFFSGLLAYYWMVFLLVFLIVGLVAFKK